MNQKKEKSDLRKFPFTEARLKALPLPPTGKRVRYMDASERGHCARVTSGGVTLGTYLRNPVTKIPFEGTNGKWPGISLKESREMTCEHRKKLGKGIDPNAEKNALRSETTLRGLFERTMENRYKIHNKSWREYYAIFDRYLTQWSNKPISSLLQSDVQREHARIGEECGIYSANRMLQLLSSLYNEAINRGYAGSNPAKGIRKFREKSRERFLEAHEMPAFFKAVQEESNAEIRDYILLSLLTGARRSNVLAMQWREVNFDSKIWSLPDTKNGTPQRIPLTDQALEILSVRRDNESEFVFAGKGGSGHLTEPKSGWKRILKRAGIENLRLHDLRRSLGSWQAATGASLSIIGKTLNHKTVSTTAIYARLNIDPVRSALETATHAMLVAGEVIPKGEIVEIKSVGRKVA